MTHNNLHLLADRYAAIRALICGPEQRLNFAIEVLEALAGKDRPTPDQFDNLIDAVIDAVLTE